MTVKVTAKTIKTIIMVLVLGLLSIVLLNLFSLSRHVPLLTVYTYNNFPPYIINSETEQGISYDWVKAVNRHLQDIQLQVQPLTRPELDDILASEPAFILWTLPRFFPEHPDYLASDAIFMDSFILISRKSDPVKTLSAIKGKRLCQIRGWVFPELNDMLNKGELTRVEGHDYADCLSLLEQNKLDLVWFSKSVYLTYPTELRANTLYMMDPPVEIISRSVVITPDYLQWAAELNAAIQAIRQDPLWHSALLQYGSQDFVDLFTLDISQLQGINLQSDVLIHNYSD